MEYLVIFVFYVYPPLIFFSVWWVERNPQEIYSRRDFFLVRPFRVGFFGILAVPLLVKKFFSLDKWCGWYLEAKYLYRYLVWTEQEWTWFRHYPEVRIQFSDYRKSGSSHEAAKLLVKDTYVNLKYGARGQAEDGLRIIRSWGYRIEDYLPDLK